MGVMVKMRGLEKPVPSRVFERMGKHREEHGVVFMAKSSARLVLAGSG